MFTAKKEKKPQPVDLWWKMVNGKDGYAMVRVPGGFFWMGSEVGDPDAWDHEKLCHRHELAWYDIGVYCVTVAQFGRFVQESGYSGGQYPSTGSSYDGQRWGYWKNDPPEYPVRYVNWFDAEAYAKWSGLRLPTEAEWELAARGYEGYRYPWGNDWENGNRVCWTGQKGPKGVTAPVNAHPEGVGPFGTFQQAGNLWEWCADWYEEKAYQRYATGDFSLPKIGRGRVLRGGSWLNLKSRLFRGALRYDGDPRDRGDDNGFRLARTVTL